MSLEQALNDLNSDVDNISIENVLINSNVNNNSNNSPAISDPNIFITNKKFSNTTINKIDELMQLCSLQGSCIKVNRLEFKIAQEVFTMLPELVTPIDVAKLTQNPSESNKVMVDKVLNSSITENLTSVSDELRNNSIELGIIFETIKNNDLPTLLNFIRNFNEVNQVNYDKLLGSNHLVMTDKTTTVDLINASMLLLSELNDSDIDYEKYQYKLRNKFNTVYGNPDFTTLCSFRGDVTEISILFLINYLKSLDITINTKVTIIEETIALLNKVSYNPDILSESLKSTSVSEIMMNYNLAIDMIKNIKDLAAVVNNSDENTALFSLIQKLLEFID